MGAGGFMTFGRGFEIPFWHFLFAVGLFFFPLSFCPLFFFFWAPLPAKSEFLEAGVIYG